jgi:hypothetical protein
MATIVLQAAGAFLGGVFGPVGAAIGSALGATAGYMVDRSLLQGTQRYEGPRLGTVRPFLAEEGAPLARVYGTARVGGDLIWATRFQETSSTTRQGGKGGGGGGTRVTTYAYFGNAAFAICEGEIAGVRRIWADGRELDLDKVDIRIHTGSETQLPDPLIQARQGAGNAPAYRGTAYAVIDRFPLGEYGNRLPQFQFEVIRPVGRLHKAIRSVALIPGSTEHGLSPSPVTRTRVRGETEQLNRQVLHARSDIVASLDELQATCPNLREVALIVSWFGDDLRAGQCRIRPTIVERAATNGPAWRVSGLTRSTAPQVTQALGGAAYGGSPDDRSVIAALAEIRSRGLKVTLCPFVMMDIPASNTLDDPYGGEAQAAYPWRGRVTCDPAPGREGSADKTAAARTQVAAFCGAAQPGHFAAGAQTVNYSGPSGDWGYRRLVLHYARLALMAGGCDGFVLGSELRGLTTLRDDAGDFPFVEQLCTLAGEVRTMLGPDCALTYGADWSEYSGHRPDDGSGDVFFHLDPLWAHAAISAVGIDNYMPLADWRDGDHAGGNPDGFASPDDLAGLMSQIEGGEGHDWFYGDDEGRRQRQRLANTDEAYGRDWVFRYKDVRNWWLNEHRDRPLGVEVSEPTAWISASKPIWFTELGCPAVDKGANQPNVFPDPKSSEGGVPHHSNGGRSDIAQHRFLLAHHLYWTDDDRNPISPVYGGPMVDTDRMTVWAWDARPYPAFPLDAAQWRDGENWQRGHWLNGRLTGVTLTDLIEAVLADHDLGGDASGVSGSLDGLVVDAPTTARSTLARLCDLFGVAAGEHAGRLHFLDEGGARGVAAISERVLVGDGTSLTRRRESADELPGEVELGFIDSFNGYQSAVARAARPERHPGTAEAFALSACLEPGGAEALLHDWMRRRWSGRDALEFALPAEAVRIVPGSVVRLGGEADAYLVTRVEAGLVRNVSARRIVRRAPTPWRPAALPEAAARPPIAGLPHALLLDLPMLPGAASPAAQLKVAAHARPWRAQAVLASPEGSGFSQMATVPLSGTIGELVGPIWPGFEGRLDRAGEIWVRLYGGELAAVSDAQLLNGANMAAVGSMQTGWELIQFADAEEMEPSIWRLRGLLRGLWGTDAAMRSGAQAAADFVLLDGAVFSAGLVAEQGGLALNWRIGPSGYALSDERFASFTLAGGLRAQVPLSPVHLRAREAGGGLRFEWIRRGRIAADVWMGEEIPLGEETELYVIEVAEADGPVRRTATVAQPHWTYPAELMTADFATPPDSIDVAVRQVSATVGPGTAATRRFALDGIT